jgi:hypothetical protein
MAKKKMPTQKIDVDAVDPDKLKSEGPLNYEMICKLVGELYLESYRRTSSVEEQAHSLIDRLNKELDVLHVENRTLKETLEGIQSGSQ